MRRRTKWAIAAGAAWTSFVFGLGLGAGGAGEVATPAASGPIVVVVPQSGASDGRTATITATPVPDHWGGDESAAAALSGPGTGNRGGCHEACPPTMDNRICGPGHEPSTITVALNK